MNNLTNNFTHLILISILIAYSLCSENCLLQQMQYEIQQIDEQVQTYKSMKFLNSGLLLKNIVVGEKQEELFEKVKIKKFTSVKLDVSQEIKQTSFSHISKQNTQNLISHGSTNKSIIQKYLLSDLFPISTFSIPSKRLSLPNFYNHLLFRLSNHFYSIEGQKLFTLPFIKSQSISLRPLISSVRNENFFVAQYTDRSDGQSLDLRIHQVEMKSREVKVRTEGEFSNLLVEDVGYKDGKFRQEQIYEHFFTFSSYQNKRTYYILGNKKQIHFYFYSQKVQQLILDQNKTLNINQLLSLKPFNYSSSQPFEFQEIKKMVKMNTFLLLVTNRNNLLSINLMGLMSSKRREYIQVHESVRVEFEEVMDLKFNDQDYRQFFVVTDQSVYQYHVSNYQIGRKFHMDEIICKENESLLISQFKCIENIEILERFLLVQYRWNSIANQSAKENKVQFSYKLIDRQSSQAYKLAIPFIHQKKCSSSKKFLLSKNKNSHYILTLACFINSPPGSNPSVDSHIILEHLNLETNGDLLPQGDLGGLDFSKFRLPMIVFSIGLICYITIKRNSKKSPEKQIEEQKMSKKFEEEILETIKREKQRQQNLNAARSKRQESNLK